ncbi:hypothetical protein C6P40_000726 [Pichia californica]|uniref:Bas1p n=1 Tax=Pichia californica TaxID=460514 RepID=A0A9P6WKF4_9ASCO|nr:hypothetical protein C6P42_000699 [[Candida] californica]KAG0688617.1 hypothetical protein C6P40_000726 [[Candida] californica]
MTEDALDEGIKHSKGMDLPTNSTPLNESSTSSIKSPEMNNKEKEENEGEYKEEDEDEEEERDQEEDEENTNDSKDSSISSSSSSSLSHVSDKTTLIVEKPVVGSIDHLAISKSLGYQIFRKAIRNAWNIDEDKCLKKLLIEQHIKNNKLDVYNNEHIDIKQIDWFDIASKMKTKRKGKECKKRWVSSLDPFLRKGKWTQAEDDALINAFKKHGASWQKVASEIKGRNEDQCSKRYTEVLNSDTKERLKPWNLDEDLLLIEQVKQFGTKWRHISNFLPSRPSLTCRNRWRKIMTDIAKDSASDVIKKAVGVLDENGTPIVKFKQSNNRLNDSPKGIQDDNKNLEARSKSNNKTKTSKKKTNDNDKTHIRQKRSLENNVNNNDQINYNNSKRQHTNSNINGKEEDNESFKSTTAYPRMEIPVTTQTDWSFSLVDPRSSEELKSFTSKISTQELAHYLIELARFNGVSLTVHQHIHHHYSSPASAVSSDPQTNLSRYGHFNYLPPLIEVPKLTSSSSPDNTVDSTSSNKNYGENPLLRLLNNEDGTHMNQIGLKHRKTNNSSESNTINDTTPANTTINNNNNNVSNNGNNHSKPNNNSVPPKFQKFHRQQFGSTRSHPSHSLEYNNGNNNIDTSKVGSPTTSTSSKVNRGTNVPYNGKKYITEDLEEELDFWETMRSIGHPKNSKPVSQHHPLHYYQPSNYKEQLPYQPSDSFGIQRFPNMATPLIANMISRDDKTTQSVQTNITNVNTEEGFNGIYMGGANSDQDEDEEDEMDIANQYGLYYSVFANRNQGNFGNYGKPQNSSVSSHTGPADLVNSGYLMPFNPS